MAGRSGKQVSADPADDAARAAKLPPPEPPSSVVETVPPVERAAFRTGRQAALDSAFERQNELRQTLTENLTPTRIRKDRLDERVQRAFARFDPSIRPRHDLPTRRTQLDPGEAPIEVTQRLLRERLDALSPEPRIAIRAESPLIAWDLTNGEERSGSIELSSLLDLVSRHGGAPLTRPASPAVAACRAEQAAQAMIDEIERTAVAQDVVGSDSQPTNGQNGAPNGDKIAGFVERSVDGQMRSATAPEAQLTYGLIPNGADQNDAQARLLETFELRPGAADVTAYHDFSTLQIAFEDVWTQVFDGELESLGRELYREYVGLKDFLGYDPATADRPISSRDDLAWLIGEIRTLSQLAQDGIPSSAIAPVGTGSIPKSTDDIAKAAEGFVESLPGGRVGTAVSTLGLSELALWVIREAGTFGRKTALRWDDLLNGRTLERGDRILGSVTPNAVAAGSISLVLRTDISRKKDVAFQLFDQPSQKFVNLQKVANTSGQILTNSAGQPSFYEDEAAIPVGLLPAALLEFSSQEGEILLGRYVLGDLEKIVPDGARLTLYWKDA